MGQKVNPIGIRLGIVKDWSSLWYEEGTHFKNAVHADILIRKYIEKELAHASVSRIQIERLARSARVTVFTARPGIVIGKKGEDIEKLRQKVSKSVGEPVTISIEEIRKPELDAKLVAAGIAQQLERRVMFRRAMKRAVTMAMRSGAKGIKVSVAGRLSGAEIARSEGYREGRVPLHTLRADIDYGVARAETTYGIIGVKVWIFKGEIMRGRRSEKESATSSSTS